MKKVLSLLLLLSIIFYGCSADITREEFETNEDYYTRVNKIFENEDDLLIKTDDSRIIKAKEFSVSVNTIQFVNLETEQIERIPVNNILEVKFHQVGLGMLNGFISGAITGGVLGTSMFSPQDMDGAGYVLAIAFVGGGALIGMVIGAFFHPTTVVYLNH